MKDKIFEIIIGAFKRKLICSDMVEMDKIAGGINEATKAHYLPVIEKYEELVELLKREPYQFPRADWDRWLINIKRLESELATLKDKLKDK